MRKLIVFLTLVVTFVLFTISTYTLLFSFPIISDTFEQFNNIIGIKLTSDQSDRIDNFNNFNNFNKFGQKTETQNLFYSKDVDVEYYFLISMLSLPIIVIFSHQIWLGKQLFRFNK
jgi:hypothetical protein